MKIYKEHLNYEESIKLAQIEGSYSSKVIFHAYWNGKLSLLHFVSVFSCFYFNVRKNKNFEIILWVNNSPVNKFFKSINEFATIKEFNQKEEIKGTIFEREIDFINQDKLTHQANLIRSILLYNYGGCWFDLDVFFLRSFEPLFYKFKDEICLYRWGEENYPNNAIYFSLEKKSKKYEKNLEYIISKNKGWGFQQANLTFDTPLDFLILPCEWFDGAWIDNPYSITWDNFFKKTNSKINLGNFFTGAFTFHWHNRWDAKVHRKSPFMQLFNLIYNDYQKNDKEKSNN